MMKQKKKMLKELLIKNRYISPEERQQVIDELRLVSKNYV